MQGALSAMFRQKQKTIAVVKTLGSSYRFLLANYLGIVVILGFCGTLCGFVLGMAIKQFFPVLFQELLPAGIGLTLNLDDIGESLTIGLIVVGTFYLSAALPAERGQTRRDFSQRHTARQPAENALCHHDPERAVSTAPGDQTTGRRENRVGFLGRSACGDWCNYRSKCARTETHSPHSHTTSLPCVRQSRASSGRVMRPALLS